jgi:two-component system, OmpR family, response regulator
MENSAPKILIVDDDAAIRELVQEYLSENGFAVIACANGRQMREGLAANDIKLMLCDVKLPGEDGFALAREVRGNSDVPIIMLTGQAQEIDRVLGLELGADDYLTKPFSPRELLARIKAVLRRYEAPVRDAKAIQLRRESEIRTYKFATWELSTGTRKLKAPDGTKTELTNGEFALLITFLKAPHVVLSRDQLLEGSRLHDDIFDRSIDVQILRLRQKIEVDPKDPKLIRTERGVGYCFAADVQ